MALNPHALPRPGPRWGPCPMRGEAAPPRPHVGQGAPWLATGLPLLPAPWVLRSHARWLRAIHASTQSWSSLKPDEPPWLTRLDGLKTRLMHQGLASGALCDALACVAAAVSHTQGLALSKPQLLAATFMLDNRLAEMATGEGKTLAMATAAAVAAMAGVPTHVMTANTYLAERDAQAMAELWRALGLKVSHLHDAQTPEERAIAHVADIVYGTAKDFAFDHLRDLLCGRTGLANQQPMLRGLCLALLDEADSLLLDEANVPLILSAPTSQPPQALAQRRALWWQAWQLSGELNLPLHARVDAMSGQAQLTPLGCAHLSTLAAPLAGLWQRPRVRETLLQLALSARHGLQRDVHYVLKQGQVQLLDTLTGRVAEGRVLAQGLHTLVELKEGLHPTPPSETVAQITFPRFFNRYWRLGGLSATLWEDRTELQALHGLSVVRLPTRLPSQRQTWPTRHCASATHRWHWVAHRAQAMQAQGRPVLIGTDTVEASHALSEVLKQQGIAHAVLNAHQDATEAEIVAQAGRAGTVTVATRMAGRGTDIQLDARALAAGGLHVIHCQRNESPRMDRQLLGRCARQGQPGSTETVICTRISPEQAMPQPVNLQSSRCMSIRTSPRWQTLLHMASERLRQWLQAQRQSSIRRRLLEQDRQWDTQRHHARALR
jgi:preprotein translocase subunit SecA